MSYTNNDFNLLNLEENTGGGTTTIIQQTTDANRSILKLLLMLY
jgi:hypothetical protein